MFPEVDDSPAPEIPIRGARLTVPLPAVGAAEAIYRVTIGGAVYDVKVTARLACAACGTDWPDGGEKCSECGLPRDGK